MSPSLTKEVTHATELTDHDARTVHRLGHCPRRAAKFDGQWSTEPGPWWVSSKVEDTAGHSFTVGVDDEGILYVCPEGYVFDRNTAFMYRLTKEGGLAMAAEAVADAIRKLLPLT
ncbi:hypothetical protein OHU07_31300 [Streptomyces phaeochromogenes]|uniref:hypothetical protein n=1 Tax=Streptomyces phaeochromogenes TaxID=1923 RepID=UPI002E290BDE|nr:hypothetical protein [Streptomyces phaeochromogenes]